MNKNIIFTMIGVFAIGAVINESQAHNPAEHVGKAEKPKCEAMKSMEPNSNKNDPVYLAMMLKCGNAVMSTATERSSSDAEQSAPNNDTNDDHESNIHQH